MKISELFTGKTVLSFEIFPPRPVFALYKLYETIAELKGLNPDFISVTYSAGGTGGCQSTVEIASNIKNLYGMESVAHITCIHRSKEEIADILAQLKEKGVDNILALRGDKKEGEPVSKDFAYASELIEFIKERGEFSVSAACYPEGHCESSGIVDDILNLKRKVDAGVDHLISQLFFDNSYFYNFLERARIAGINVPIQAGIMPVTNKNQIEKIVGLCGATLPKKFVTIMNKYENDPIALRDAGIAYAMNQIVDLVAEGVDGIHLYTMNNPYVASTITKQVASLFKPFANEPAT